MKLGQWTKILLVCSCIILLTACHARKYRAQNAMAVNDANAAYTGANAESKEMAQSSGLGEESRFGDQAPGNRKARLASADGKRTYYFDFDSNVVKEEDKPAIASNAEYLISRPKTKILLEGHTDPRGSREYNIGLGERRAKAVAEILAAKGVDPNQIRIVSYGAEKLASNEHSESAYQLDRRGVLIYMKR